MISDFLSRGRDSTGPGLYAEFCGIPVEYQTAMNLPGPEGR